MEQTSLRDRFLEGMSLAASTVNIVTTDGVAGRAGVTVSAMASVTADTAKPTLLVCVHHLSPAASAIVANGVFHVNVLRDDQSYISDCFAGRIKPAPQDKFDCATWTTDALGAPRLVDPLVGFDCRLVQHQRIGTHHVFFGETEEIFLSTSGSPLVYSKRAYGRSTRIDTVRSDHSKAAEAVKLGVFHTFGPYFFPQVLARLQASGKLGELVLTEGNQRRVLDGLRSGDIELAVIYDFDLDSSFTAERLTSLHPHVLLPEDHPLARHSEIDLEVLAGEPLILLDAPPSAGYFLSLFAARGLTPNIRVRSPSFEMVRGMVGHRLGYSLLSTQPVSNMTYDGQKLVVRSLDRPVPPSYVSLVTRTGAQLSRGAQDFANECRNFFRELESGNAA